jgi:purine-binding chemotaxis protein CheW
VLEASVVGVDRSRWPGLRRIVVLGRKEIAMSMSSERNDVSVDPAITSDADQLQLVTFEVGEEEFAIDILQVQEINRMMELTRVPQSPPEVEGVINLRGRIIPVIDLRKTFNLEDGARDEHSRIVVVEVKGRIIGFLVDRVHEVLRIDAGIVEPPPSMISSVDSDYISGVGKLNDRLLILLNLDKLFGADLLGAAEEAAEAAGEMSESTAQAA